MPHPKRTATVLAVAILVAVLVATAAWAAGDDAERPGPVDARSTVAAQADATPAGPYTQEQADRGAESYAEHCAECHAPDARGRSPYISLYAYPALTGTYFMDRWAGQNVRTLFEVIRATMPLDAPNSLDADEYADITAHVLRLNGFPAGDRELPAAAEDGGRLSGIVIEPDAASSPADVQDPSPIELRARDDADERDLVRPAPGDDPPADDPPEDEVSPPWYAVEQADRGRIDYVEHCARCHGRALQGTGAAPSLAGGNFIARWEEATLDELFFVIHNLMPLDAPASLDTTTYVDLLAYLLDQNGFEAGEDPLPEDGDGLDRYVVRPDYADVPDVP